MWTPLPPPCCCQRSLPTFTPSCPLGGTRVATPIALSKIDPTSWGCAIESGELQNEWQGSLKMTRTPDFISCVSAAFVFHPHFKCLRTSTAFCGTEVGKSAERYPQKMNYALNCKYSISSPHLKVPKEIWALDLKCSSSDISWLCRAPPPKHRSLPWKIAFYGGATGC